MQEKNCNTRKEVTDTQNLPRDDHSTPARVQMKPALMTLGPYLDGSLLFADIVGLQLLWLWQRSADRRPETDSCDKRIGIELLFMLTAIMMMTNIIRIIALPLLHEYNTAYSSQHSASPVFGCVSSSLSLSVTSCLIFRVSFLLMFPIVPSLLSDLIYCCLISLLPGAYSVRSTSHLPQAFFKIINLCQQLVPPKNFTTLLIVYFSK